jgi:alkanesulfonate monooxygenase SsuD/methylene tetrahydromethanopterin reductase-like flavin-dependent oxidoreductase (luciferase family)
MAEVALYLPQLRMDVATILERAQVADEAGLAGVWLMDHLAAPLAPELDTHEGWTTATAVACHTERIRIGHLVLCNAFRHPALLAKMAVTLDHVSDGRLDLGLGWGSVPAELRMWGFGDEPAWERSARLAESIEVMQALWTGERVRYEGQFWNVDGAVARPLPIQEPIPLHIGGAGERLTLPLVDRYADWWNCPAYALGRLAPLTARLRTDRPELKVSVQHPVGLAATTSARDEVRNVAERRFGAWGGVVTGTPDDVVAALRREAEAGADLFICQLHDFGQPDTIRLLAEAVAPALR